MARRGRRTTYTQTIAAKLCYKLVEGKSLNKACEEKGMPDKSTVLYWLTQPSDFREDFAAQYAQARRAQAWGYADEIIEISDDGTLDKKIDDDGNVRTDWENVQRSKLRVDSRKWILSKLLPKEFGGDPEPETAKKRRDLKLVRSGEPDRLKKQSE